MIPPVLHLRSGDPLLINGGWIEFRSKASFVLLGDARFLFGAQVMSTARATTPLRQLYRALQDAYVGPEVGRQAARRVADMGMRAATEGLSSGQLMTLAEALILFDAGRQGEAMRAVRQLVHELEGHAEQVVA